MKSGARIGNEATDCEADGGDGPALLRSLVQAAGQAAPSAPAGVTIGRLVGFIDAGRTPLVWFDGMAGAQALAARSVVDLHGALVGRDVVLSFERADPARPVVLGVLADQPGWPQAAAGPKPAQVEVDADGRRMVVSARDELVLRCGKSSLLLRSDGRIELRGETIVSQAADVNRVRGGSVQLN